MKQQHCPKWKLFAHQLVRQLYYQFNATFRRASGVLEKKREMPLIISLTSIPERMHTVHLCIETLLEQSVKPDHIILWLSETFDKGMIPVCLHRLVSRGLQIRFCRDIGPYTKLIYTLRENPQSLVVTADDDWFYPGNWLKGLFESYQKEPQYIHCHRAHLITKIIRYDDWQKLSPGIAGPSHYLFPTGGGGVLYPPDALHPEVFNEQLFLRICPTGDDIWFKAMSLLNGVACKKVNPFFSEYVPTMGWKEKALYHLNVLQKKNDEQIQATFEHFDLYRLIYEMERMESLGSEGEERGAS